MQFLGKCQCHFSKNQNQKIKNLCMHAVYSVPQSCLILCNPIDYNLPGSSVHGLLPGKNTGLGCHFLLQEIFSTQGSSWHLCVFCIDRWNLLPLYYLMETEKTPNQISLEKEKQMYMNQALRLQTILQSYSNQDTLVLAQKQKYKSMEKDWKSISLNK